MEIETYKMDLITLMILVHKQYIRLSNLMCPLFQETSKSRETKNKLLTESLFLVSTNTKSVHLKGERLIIIITLTGVMGGDHPPDVPDVVAAHFRLGGGGQLVVGSGGGQQLIPLLKDVLGQGVDGDNHEERGHSGHQALQHHGHLLLGGVQGEFRHFTNQGSEKRNYLKLSEAEKLSLGLGGDSRESRQKGTHLDVQMLTGDQNKSRENMSFPGYRKRKVDSLTVITLY